MRTIASMVIFSMVFAVRAPDALAKRSCGSASCPLNTFTSLRGGWLQLGLSHEYILQDQLFLGSSRSHVGAIPERHDEVQTLNERNVIQLQAGILDRLGVGVDVPFIHREHSHIHHSNSGDEWESWNFNGMGDIVISGRYTLLLPSREFEPYVSISLGMKLPTGNLDARNMNGEEAEVALQPGNGSTDGIIGVNYRQSLFSIPTLSGEFSALPMILGATFQITGRGKDEYRFGNTLLAHIGTVYQFADRVSFLLQVNGRFQNYTDVGLTDEPRENTGGTWVFASPGLGLTFSDEFSGSAYVQLPLYQNMHGLQQTSRFNLSLNLSYSLNAFASE